METDLAEEELRARRSAPPVIGLALAFLAMGVVAVVPAAEAGSREEAVIAAYLEAWYSGDYEGAMALRAPQPIRTGPPEERARAETRYQALLGARVEVLECEPLPPRTRRCLVTYANALNDSVGSSPALVSLQFGMDGGLVQFVAGPYLEDEGLADSFRRYAEAFLLQRYEDACDDGPGYQDGDCAVLIRGHIEGWAEWHRVETRG